MFKPSLFPWAKRIAPALLIAALAAPLHAQTLRPGGSARGNTRGGGAIGNRTTGAGGANSTGARQYRSNTMLGEAMIQVDPETRSLVVVTDEDTHLELSKVIRSLDQPKPQVLINVVFLEVTYNKGSDIGVEGSYTFNLKNGLPGSTGSVSSTNVSTRATGNANFPGTTTTTTTSTTPTNVAASLASTVGLESVFGLAQATDGTFARVITDDWQATLRLMATNGKVEVLSRPSILARNNQEAVIVVGQEVPFITNSRITDNGQTINTIEYDNIGIILRVTPFITSDGMVEMIVAPEISTLTDRTVPISNNAAAPVIAKRSAETVVVTPNGATAVIGGLMETQRIESVRKIPILGDIPILGLPFRRTIKDDVKKELMIFLTPHVISRPSQVEELASSEIARTELVEKAFTETEMEKFFENPLQSRKDSGEAVQVRRAIPVAPVTKVTVTESETVVRTPVKADPAPPEERNVRPARVK